MRTTFVIILSLIFLVSRAQENCLPDYGVKSGFARLDSGSISWVEMGKGRPILFIHGLGGNASHWMKVARQLSVTHHCIVVDLPGYGHSKDTIQSADPLATYAAILSQLVTHLKLKNPILAGHSMGAQVAVIAAAGQPGQFDKLVLVSAAGLETFTDAEAGLLIQSTAPKQFEQQTEPMVRASFRRNFFNQPEDAENLIQYRLKQIGCPAFPSYCRTVSNGVKGMLFHPVIPELKQLKQPVLLVFGKEDALIPNKYLHPALTLDVLLKDAARLIGNLKVSLIPSAGHLLPFEKPEELTEAIQTFIKTQ